VTDLDQPLTRADPLTDTHALTDAHRDQLLDTIRTRCHHADVAPATSSTPRTRHRPLTAVVGVAVLTAAAALVVTHQSEDTSGPVAGTVPDGTTPAAGPVFGGLPFTVTEDKKLESQPGGATCALTIDLGPRATPRTIGLPCGTDFLTGPASETPPMSRDDRVLINDRPVWVITGSVPTDAVAVTATSEHGTPLTATLQHPTFSPTAVFALKTTGRHLYRLRYQLADGTLSYPNDITDPKWWHR